jgi:hypothetical protein
VSVLVRCGTVVMRLMVVAGVLVDVQRRQDAWCGDQSRDEQTGQRTPHVDKSMRGTMEGQPASAHRVNFRPESCGHTAEGGRGRAPVAETERFSGARRYLERRR